MNPSKPLPIHERFMSFQGEGVHMGRPAFFVRLHGCPVKCPYCDSAGTWNPDWVPKEVLKLTPQEIAREINNGPRPEFIVVTGGEPTIHNLEDLTEVLKERGWKTHLETSGSFPLTGNWDWITLSPKRWKVPLAENVALADEFKFIIEAPPDIAFYFDLIASLGFSDAIEKEWRPMIPPIWLHPEWGHRQDPVVIGAIADAVRFGEGRYRAGWQMHKLFQVDVRDSRTQPLVPLGGDLRKGY